MKKINGADAGRAGRNFTKIVMTAAASAMLLGGCGQLEKTVAGQSGHKPIIMGATYMTKNNPYFDVLNEGIAGVVEGNGDILISRDPSQNQKKQNEQIREMIDEGIEVLFLNPVDWQEVTPALEQCKEAGVTVIDVDTAVEAQEYAVTLIETDNYQAGVLCAEDMMKRLDKAKIVVLVSPMQRSIANRIQGFLDTIEGNENYQVVYEMKIDSDFEVSASNMSIFLNKKIAFDVVMGGNDPIALGALSALQKAGYKKDILIYGIDGSPDAKSLIAAGEMTGTSVQSPGLLGRTAAETAYRYLNGEEIEDYISIPPELINIDNVSQYSVTDWE